MPIAQIPALKDNYIYIISKNNSSDCIVIDPGESEPVIDYCKKNSLTPKVILCTHHHNDHIDGVKKIVDAYKCPVYVSEHDKTRIPLATHFLAEGQILKILDITFHIIFCPGHTLGAITFYLNAPESLKLIGLAQPVAFTGDTLFSLGCGRLFEGTPEMMWDSLGKLKSTLDSQTLIYSGHEYTLRNADFALQHAPRPGLSQYRKMAQDAEISGKFIVPTRFSDELLFNPFLNTQSFAEFKRLRALRNEFKLEP